MPPERDTTTADSLGVTPRHRQAGPVPTLGGSIVAETNVSPVFFAEIQTQADLDASRANRPVTDCDYAA
ncbi:MAG: hypothetical protein JWQ60_5157 [Pseudonocardia sp.]|nr:hypothetical protein [Pseudonocardia sp.]